MLFSRLNLGRLVSGGLITNYFCTSACRHGLYNCSPAREKDSITPAAAEESLRAVKSLGCTAVHIGGGEPLLRPEALGEVLDAARRAGVSVDYVETNAAWFTGAESARELLAPLGEKGLRTLLVSISPFHNEHIPYFLYLKVGSGVFKKIFNVYKLIVSIEGLFTRLKKGNIKEIFLSNQTVMSPGKRSEFHKLMVTIVGPKGILYASWAGSFKE
jgi:MoaA/NifB/PqqE/SkfB family radical SAM enzyme